jgi:hypothetical protein
VLYLDEGRLVQIDRTADELTEEALHA